MIIVFHGQGPWAVRLAQLAALGLGASQPVLDLAHGEDYQHFLAVADDATDLVATAPHCALADRSLRRVTGLPVVVAGPTSREALVASHVAASSKAATWEATPAWLLPVDEASAGHLPKDARRRLPPAPLRCAAAPAFSRRSRVTLDLAARLAASLLLAAADPWAEVLKPALLTEVMAGRTAADIDLRDRLLAVSAAFDETSGRGLWPSYPRRRLHLAVHRRAVGHCAPDRTTRPSLAAKI